MKKQSIFTSMFILAMFFFAMRLDAGNCLEHLNTFFKAGPPDGAGVDSILVFKDNGTITNEALITINRDNASVGENVGTYLFHININPNFDNDNVSLLATDNVSLGDKLGITVDEAHPAYSYLETFLNGKALGYTTYDNGSFIWLYDGQNVKSLSVAGKIVDLAVAKTDNTTFYALTYDGAIYSILKVDSDLANIVTVYIHNSVAMPIAHGQIFYYANENGGLDLLFGADLDTPFVTIEVFKSVLFNIIDFSNPLDITQTYDNVSQMGAWLAHKEDCNSEYDFFNLNFNYLGVYKHIDNTTNKLVSNMQLYPADSGFVAGDDLYLGYPGVGLNAIDITNPEMLQPSSWIGTTELTFKGYIQDIDAIDGLGSIYIIAAGGGAGLGVFRADYCYKIFVDINALFSEKDCGNDNNSGGGDNESASCGECFNADDVDNFSSGWHLAGTGCGSDILNMNIFVGAKTVWKWSGQSWQIFSLNPSVMAVLSQYNIPSFYVIHAKEGFWVNK